MIDNARQYLRESGLVRETPLIGDVANVFSLLESKNIELYIKLETMQTIGS